MKTIILFFCVILFSNHNIPEIKKEKFNFSKVNIKTFNEFYEFLKDTTKLSIEELSINGNLIDKVNGYTLVSDSFFNKLENLKNLKKLDIEGCKLNKVPFQILSLYKLETLSLRANRIKKCPSLIYTLKNLKRIDLSYNKIENITELFTGDISKSKISSISLHDNLIDSIPNAICNLKHLEHLFLNENKIQTIPCCISEFEMFHFVIQNNPIKEIPECFCRYYEHWFELEFSFTKEIKIPECLDDTTIPLKNRIYYR